MKKEATRHHLPGLGFNVRGAALKPVFLSSILETT